MSSNREYEHLRLRKGYAEDGQLPCATSKGNRGRSALESREVDQAILVQFVIKRHAANAELRGGPQAIVPMLAQHLDDPRHFGLPPRPEPEIRSGLGLVPRPSGIGSAAGNGADVLG